MQNVRFKSYYVVWKQNDILNKFYYGKCLNRTMQYGNQVHRVYVYSKEQGLNRTMQYGNPLTEKDNDAKEYV